MLFISSMERRLLADHFGGPVGSNRIRISRLHLDVTWPSLCLLGPKLRKLLLAALLVSLRESLGVKELVPPAEAGGIVANELLMVKVMVVGASPEGEELAQAPREVVAAVRVDGLEEAQNDPQIHGQQMEVAKKGHPDNRRSDNAETQKHNLDWRSILGS